MVVLGENGSGKSTLLRLLAGLAARPPATVQVQGRPVTPRDPDVPRPLGLVAHQSTLYDDLTRPGEPGLRRPAHGLPDPRRRRCGPWTPPVDIADRAEGGPAG